MADPDSALRPGVVSQEFEVANYESGTALRSLVEAGFVVIPRESARTGYTVLAASRHLHVPSATVDQFAETHRRVAIAAVEAAGVQHAMGSAVESVAYALDPTRAIAAIVRAESAEGKRRLLTGDHEGTVDDARFLGTAFAFRDPSNFITARHCVEGIPVSDLVLSVGFARRCFEVRDVHLHESADLAVMDLGSGAWPPAAPFMGVRRPSGLGMTVSAYGLPEELPGAPVPRLFRGHVQRFIDYQSLLGHGMKYLAAELSFAVPVGLSGGPCYVFGERLHDVFAVAVENVRSATYTGETETIVHDEHRTETIRERDMVSYGIALVLWPLIGWLDEVCPIHVRPAPE